MEIKKFIKEHKKEVIIVGGALAVGTIAVVCIKTKPGKVIKDEMTNKLVTKIYYDNQMITGLSGLILNHREAFDAETIELVTQAFMQASDLAANMAPHAHIL